jgi:hypothetical protein
MRSARLPLLLVTVTLVSFLAANSIAWACGLDGIPSLLADGQRDRINTATPTTAAQVAAWTPFVLARSFPAKQAITLTEIRSEVAKSLTAAAMRHPWRWRFSDGTVAHGWTVKHAFAKPGTWRIAVDAYYPGNGKWYQFDTATVVIRAPEAHH